MPDHRENILANLVTTLQGITTAAGYSVTVATAERGVRLWNQVPEGERPYLGILPGIGRTVQIAGGQIKVAVPITIVGYLALASDKTEAERGATLNAFIVDVKKALLVDPSRGGNAVATSPVQDGNDEGAEVRPGMIEVEFECAYWHSRTEF